MGKLMNALRCLLNFLCWLILYPFAFQRIAFWKSDDANQPNQPTSQKPIKMDNFYKNCPIWLKLGMQVSYRPPPPVKVKFWSEISIFKHNSRLSKVIVITWWRFDDHIGITTWSTSLMNTFIELDQLSAGWSLKLTSK